ncbi:DUF1990 family protein [Ornithinimicrobium cerasi]|uniref:DUF1990 family protein n=1 Tax=Ornithinimicrobium cerasi TaxID=2248773 RepID=UPI000F00224D|nr:DUF1990 domain-containing protein [Ornithinimicrobium cerasi]
MGAVSTQAAAGGVGGQLDQHNVPVSVSRLDEAEAAALRAVPFSYAPVGVVAGAPPRGFRRFERSTVLGRRDFAVTAQALLGGRMHSAAGLTVQLSDDPLQVGSVVLLRLGWGVLSLRIPCRVVDVIDEPHRKGFSYGTLPGHPEAGEERFLLEQRRDGRLILTITACSRPATTTARLAGPLGRVAQSLITRRYLRAMDYG